MHDIIVVGKGMFGAAAARHLSAAGADVAIIGPDEPANPDTHQGVFGAHYDAARLTYRLTVDAVWAELNRRGLAALPALEAESGLALHTPAGCLYVTSPALDDGSLAAAEPLGQKFGVRFAALGPAELRQRFPAMRFAPNAQAIFEPAPAGYFNPRQLVQAELIIARNHGAAVIPQIVSGVAQHNGAMTVTTVDGATYRAGKVLVAAGGFSNGFNLLPRPAALQLKREFVVLARVAPAEAERLAALPALIYNIEADEVTELYAVPPVRYPDGHIYLKLGANTRADAYEENTDGACRWYRAGNSDEMLPALRSVVQAVYPGIAVEAWRTSRCIITYTSHRHPYIDTLIPGRLYTAIGGNGRGAKAADAIGQLAAALVLSGGWRDDLPAAAFAFSAAPEQRAKTGAGA